MGAFQEIAADAGAETKDMQASSQCEQRYSTTALEDLQEGTLTLG